MKSAVLYHRGKKGALFQWRVWTEGADICTEYGQVDGVQQTARKRAEPKNCGRVNQTRAEEQAVLEAQALFKKRRDLKYSDTPEEAQEPLLLPMLAHPLDKKPKALVLPCDVQPKLDGVRCLAVREDGLVVLLSRSGKVYDAPHIARQLEDVMPFNSILDGELYIHRQTLQTINSLVKKNRPESALLQYHVYDVPRWESTEDLPWSERHRILKDYVERRSEGCVSIIPVKALLCQSMGQILECQRSFVQHGYEGAIVRMHHGLYLFGYRSSELLKVKTFQDAEFKVVGAHDGQGRFEDCVIWECVTADGKEFTSVQQGTTEMRKEWLRDSSKYIGRMLTVRFWNYTPDGKPFHPIGKAFRLEEDQ